MTQELYQKIERGVALSDVELRESRDFFQDLADKLHCLGPKFHFPFVECNRRALDLDGYLRHRERG